MTRLLLLLTLLSLTSSGWAQPVATQPADKPADETPPSLQIEIPDEPRTVDPTQFVPPPLAERVTEDFPETTLLELVKWLQTERKLTVRLNRHELNADTIQLDEPFVERLDNEPLYLLLERLDAQGVAWYYEGGLLHLTSRSHGEEQLTTMPYVLSDLLDAGYRDSSIISVLQTTIGADTWEEDGGPGTLSLLGDVLFVRQTQTVHRQISGLLAALRKHARMTYIDDPPHHAVLRERLAQRITVSLRDVPLVQAIREVSKVADVPIRIDHDKLREETVRERSPVTVELTDQPLSVVLNAVGAEFNLTYSLVDGLLWVTTLTDSEERLKTAVYDVRDLCRDEGESLALAETVQSQSGRDSWENNGGPGVLAFAKPGVMVISQTDRVLSEVLALLDNYRTALRASKPRRRGGPDPAEVVTRYYRLPTNMADSLGKLLPTLVQPTTWKTAEQPDATGTVQVLPSRPQLLDAQGREIHGTDKPKAGEPIAAALVVDHAVLMIRQTRLVHRDIRNLIGEIDAPGAVPQLVIRQSQAMGGGMGGGGYGGGQGGRGGGQGGLIDDDLDGGQLGFGGGYFSK